MLPSLVGRMNKTVAFDNKSRFRAIKIDNVITNVMLSSEFGT